ncbi:MAG: branched-chain amino acid ABC transporter permease [Clostridiaceae bacterium]|jgi:branched-chain amino acid transport system permease protein|nr:branched-chain amino acid ABC transporter permease [Clostridia bacterium]NMA35753.1 branched-chain amino acid ABC transporter permease [Clostridiaceae bacterium]
MDLQLLISGISLGAVYALVAVGYAVVFSVLKFSNFAHGGMISACAYMGYYFQRAFPAPPPFYVTLLFSAFAGVALSFLIDTIAYRRLRKQQSPAIYYFLASIAISILIVNLLSIFFGKNLYAFPPIFTSTTFYIGSIRFSSIDTLILFVSLAILTFLILLINRTRIGLAIRSVAINSQTSRLMGVNPDVTIMTVFAIAGALAGISGVLLAMKLSVYPTLGSQMMLKGFVASVVGGLGSLGGAIIAAIFLGVIEIYITYYLGSLSTPIVTFGLMLIFLAVRPVGVAGKFAQEKV